VVVKWLLSGIFFVTSVSAAAELCLEVADGVTPI
jgi:hypothetical protein